MDWILHFTKKVPLPLHLHLHMDCKYDVIGPVA